VGNGVDIWIEVTPITQLVVLLWQLLDLGIVFSARDDVPLAGSKKASVVVGVSSGPVADDVGALLLAERPCSVIRLFTGVCHGES
jgi:hypothetical protein